MTDLALRTPVTDLERMASAIAKSGLFGVRQPEQALALMLVAEAEGLHPAAAARDYHIINGTPALKADAILSRFLSAGGRVEWHSYTDEVCDATFSHPAGGSVRVDWDEARVKQAGLSGNHRKYPRQMKRARCISEGVRTVYPVACGGFYTPEETEGFAPPQSSGQAQVIDAQAQVVVDDELITRDEYDDLMAECHALEADVQKFAGFMGVESLDMLPRSMLARARRALQVKRQKMGEKPVERAAPDPEDVAIFQGAAE